MMPVRQVSVMSQRRWVVEAVSSGEQTVTAAAAAVGVSRQTVYRWLAAWEQDGVPGLLDQSRRPHHSPRRLDPVLATVLLEVRDAHPAWGARKLLAVVQREQPGLTEAWPAASTVTRLLQRTGRIDPAVSASHRRWQRFEAAAPNALWQMDYCGPVQTAAGPSQVLTVIDDHSRYLVGLAACPNQQGTTVQQVLTGLFATVGCPEAILCDYGSPWGDTVDSLYTRLTAWLWRLGIPVWHGRPYHPQTRGKVERVHRTMAAEALTTLQPDLPSLQAQLDRWRQVYNTRRPHDALGLAVPASRWSPGPPRDVSALPKPVPPPGLPVRVVSDPGIAHFEGRELRIGRAFIGDRVAFEVRSPERAVVYWGSVAIGEISLTQPQARLERLSQMS